MMGDTFVESASAVSKIAPPETKVRSVDRISPAVAKPNMAVIIVLKAVPGSFPYSMLIPLLIMIKITTAPKNTSLVVASIVESTDRPSIESMA